MPNAHHLDHASTTPLRPRARAAMLEAFERDWGDPSRVHRDGMEARAALEDARDAVAARLGARPREVIFTSGATESIATVCSGAASRGDRQVISAVEHSAVRLNAGAHGEVRVAPVDGSGQVDPDEYLSLVDGSTAVAHLQWGNHEVGTVQHLPSVIEGCRERGALLHVDAAQAVGRAEVDFGALGADLLSVSGHKVGGPAGIGVLLVRRGLRLDPMMAGGDQERARRAGLENVIGAIGLAAALAEVDLDAEVAMQRRLTARLDDLVDSLDGAVRYGSATDRLPHITCIGLEDIEPQAVLFGLDRRDISAHSGSACASADLAPSPVLEAMGVDAHRSLRLSVGWTTSDADIDAVCTALPEVLAELRALRTRH